MARGRGTLVQTNLTESQKERLLQVAQAKGMKVAAVTRQYIEKGLSAERTARSAEEFMQTAVKAGVSEADAHKLLAAAKELNA